MVLRKKFIMTQVNDKRKWRVATNPVDDSVVVAKIIIAETMTRADPDTLSEWTTIAVLSLFGEGSEAFPKLLKLFQVPKLGGSKRVVVFVGEVEVLHFQCFSLQRNARRVPRVVLARSELHPVVVIALRQQRFLLHCLR